MEVRFVDRKLPLVGHLRSSRARGWRTQDCQISIQPLMHTGTGTGQPPAAHHHNRVVSGPSCRPWMRTMGNWGNGLGSVGRPPVVEFQCADLRSPTWLAPAPPRALENLSSIPVMEMLLYWNRRGSTGPSCACRRSTAWRHAAQILCMHYQLC